MVECPTSEQWLKLLTADLSPAEREGLEYHLKICDTCSILLAVNAEWHHLVSGSMSVDSRFGSVTLPTLNHQNEDPSPDDRPSVGNRWTDPPEIPGLVGLKLVNRGGMGVVFSAREVNLDRTVAVKILSSRSRFAPAARERAVRESLLMASLRHPNVVQIYRTGEVDGLPYLVMEWIEGGTLKDRISAKLLSPREAAETVRLLAKAVAKAHTLNIIHRDLKPDNVMVVPLVGEGGGFIPKLTDFGLARRGEATGLTEPGDVCGTPGYMAPEQTGFASATGKVGPLTDIHGLGGILYASLTGKIPYQGASSWDKLMQAARGEYLAVRSLRPEVPLDLATIVDKCLNVDVSRRYRSAEDLADDLERFLEGRPITARPSSLPERLVKWARRHPASAASVVLLVAAFLSGVAGTVYHVASTDRALRDLAQEQDKTKQALTLATGARDQARLALASLSDDVVKRILVRGNALNDDDRAFLGQIRGYYLKWPLEPNPEEALKFRGSGLGRLGDIFEQIEQYDDARSCREAAIESYDDAIRRGFGGSEVVDARIKAMVLLHQVLERSKQPIAAEAVARRLIATHEPLARTSVNHRRNLGLDHIRLGHDLAKQQRDREAEAELETGIAQLEPLSRQNPENFDVRKAEMRAYYIAAISTKQVDRPEILYRKLLDCAEAALVIFPGNQEILRYQVICLTEMVSIMTKDRPKEALPIHRRRMKVAQELVARFPDNKQFRGDLLSGTAQTYHLYARLDRPADAEPALKQAVDACAQMVAAEPAVFDRALGLATVLEAYAMLCESTGRPNRAVEQYDKIAATFAPWMKLQGRSEEVFPGLLKARRRSAELLSNLGDHAEAARRLAFMVEVCKPEDRGRIQLDLAGELLAAGDHSGARVAAEKAAVGETGPDATKFLSSLKSKSGNAANTLEP